MSGLETAHITPEWEPLLKPHGLTTIAAVFATTAGIAIKSGQNNEVRRLELDGRILFIKKYAYPTFRLRWSGACRGTLFGISKARREYENLARLRTWGLDAPAPIAWFEERRSRWLWRAALLSESVPKPLSLDLFIRDYLPANTRRSLLENLAGYTRRMHEHRFVHHDYFWRNILLSGNSLDHFYLIDSHKGRQWCCDEQSARAKDLATLDGPAPAYFRRTERLRFFLRYLNHNRLTPDDKKLLRLILQIAEPIRAVQLRRVREAQ